VSTIPSTTRQNLPFKLLTAGTFLHTLRLDFQVMDKALEQSLSSKSFVKGLLCADLNGLLITGTTLRSEIQVTTTLTLFTLQVKSFPEDLSST
jgi:hypothetical protein